MSSFDPQLAEYLESLGFRCLIYKETQSFFKAVSEEASFIVTCLLDKNEYFMNFSYKSCDPVIIESRNSEFVMKNILSFMSQILDLKEKIIFFSDEETACYCERFRDEENKNIFSNGNSEFKIVF